MASRRGRCTNFGNCELADANQPVESADAKELVCPKCGHQLAAQAQASGGGGGLPPWIPIVAIVLLAASGVWFWKTRSRKPADPGAPSPVAVQPPAGPAATTILRLQGSNTIGAKLAPAMAAAFLKQLGATDVKSVPVKAEEVTVEATMPGQAGRQAIEVRAHGSADAFAGLGAGTCEVGMSSRRVKPEEVTALAKLGDLTSAAAEHVIGLDGVAVIVNRGNGLGAVSKDQLAKIFAGEITDWKQLQGKAGAIQLFRRDDHSGTADTFKSLVMGGRAFAAGAATLEDSQQLAEKVAGSPNGIGFVGLPYVGSAKALAVAETGAKALVPTRLTVATEDYPLSRRLYFYTAESASPLAQKFVEFAQSKAGQDLVADAGFVSQNVAAMNTASPAGGPSEYQKLTSSAERLSLNFRFQTGSSRLDNKAVVDLDRVVTFISDLRYTGNSLLLFGFADSRGARELNVKLSKERANAVAAEFEQRGLKPAVVTGFGSELPVATNDTEEGRERNRRVEVWLRKK